MWTSSLITRLAKVDILFGGNDYGFGGGGDIRMKVSTFVIVIIQTGVGHYGPLVVDTIQEMMTPGDLNRLVKPRIHGKQPLHLFALPLRCLEHS